MFDLSRFDHTLCANRRNSPALYQIERKSLEKRGCKRARRKVATHEFVVEEFTRIRAKVIRVTRKLLRAAAVEYVTNAENLDIPEVEVEQLISKYVMQDFCMDHKIVVRLQSECKKKPSIWEEY